ncbi:DUF4383 domain-containing protein [Bdellovibrio sp. SKB1291214]|uniref:DUF4383 domain-containing protein n=1 Tax=Bdellovibrio sp. SKB1291214 TaxID=1732569 RepID=UPI000B51D8CE|nr:DUF4383 domain-containing protein [Bdellovibrio sp. SKB1291214]UYL10527.1 DUF4383 domain-containing protein [Bdellovibrio sp. SKB1291214]
MQPELERNRSNPRYKKDAPTTLRGKLREEFDIQSETIKKGQLQGVLERKTYAQETSVFVGTALVVVGFIGFVVDNLLGMHLSHSHNLIHLISGILLAWFGFKNEQRAKKCSLIFGSFYAVLGVLGFIVGTPGMPNVGHLVRDDSLWMISPDKLELGSRDHVIHLVIAAALIGGALIKFRRIRREDI